MGINLTANFSLPSPVAARFTPLVVGNYDVANIKILKLKSRFSNPSFSDSNPEKKRVIPIAYP